MKYIYDNKEYENVFTLAKIIYKHYDDFALLFRTDDKLLGFIKEEDNKKYEKIMKLEKLAYPDDVFLFMVSYTLNPFMSFRLKNRVFEDYKSIGEAILSFSPNLDPILFKLIQFDMISYHMEISGYSKDHNDIYEAVKEIERIEDKQYAYFKMAYYLSKKNAIIYERKEYKDVYSFCYYIIKENSDIESLGNRLANAAFLKAYNDYNKNDQTISTYIHICEELEHSEKRLNDFLNRRKKDEL